MCRALRDRHPCNLQLRRSGSDSGGKEASCRPSAAAASGSSSGSAGGSAGGYSGGGASRWRPPRCSAGDCGCQRHGLWRGAGAERRAGSARQHVDHQVCCTAQCSAISCVSSEAAPSARLSGGCHAQALETCRRRQQCLLNESRIAWHCRSQRRQMTSGCTLQLRRQHHTDVIVRVHFSPPRPVVDGE